MTTKEETADGLGRSMLATARWRYKLNASFPDDKRNLLAAETLEKLADEATDISDTAWSELAPYADFTSPRWLEAVAQTNREVRFRRTPKDFADYLRILKVNLTRHV